MVNNQKGRFLISITLGLVFIVWLALAIWPETFGVVRAFQVFLFLLLCGGALYLGWNRRWLRWTFFVFLAIFLAIMAWPVRPAAENSLRVRYVQELKAYGGTRYVWGGENRFGIDCSGLVRRGFIHALWKEGLNTFNPSLIRRSVMLWWYDSSAAALMSEYRNQTMRFSTASSISAHHARELLPGDLAVTTDGRHVLAYIGEDQWIEADPGLRQVVILTAGKDENGWLKIPVTFVRWR